MNRYLGYCLAFAGTCLIAGASIGIMDWIVCLRYSGGSACKASRTDAMTALVGAANVALGVAVRENKLDQ
jgi:hypothetical protein